MKNTIKSKINVAGLVGYIASILLIVAAVTAFVIACLSTAAVAALPEDSVNVAVSANVDVLTTRDGLEKVKSYIQNGDKIIVEKDGEFVITDDELKNISITETDEGIAVNAGSEVISFGKNKLLLSLVAVIVLIASVVALLHTVKALMKALKNCDTPFEKNVIVKMKTFAYALIPVVVLSMVCDGVWDYLLRSGGTFDFSVNLLGILSVVIVFILIMVFTYGAELQRESDETL